MSDVQKEAHWYVIHTYSGYENRVKANLEKTIENQGLQDVIHEVAIPVENTIEIKNGKKKMVQRKLYPGYVLVKMVMSNETWYVVRNTRGVTGFVGQDTKPLPLTQEEIEKMGILKPLETVSLDVEVGDRVRVLSAPFENFIGIVQSVDIPMQTARVMISMFGRETPVDLEFSQIIKE